MRSAAPHSFLLALVPFVLALAGAAAQSKPLFAVLPSLTAERFALTGLHEAGPAATRRLDGHVLRTSRSRAALHEPADSF